MPHGVDIMNAVANLFSGAPQAQASSKEESPDFSEANANNIGDLTAQSIRQKYGPGFNRRLTPSEINHLGQAGWDTQSQVIDNLHPDDQHAILDMQASQGPNARMYGNSPDNQDADR